MQNHKDDIFSVGAYGIVSLSKPELINQKNQAKHSLVVKATDLGQPSLSAVTNLEIVVLTSTDTPPQFEELGYLFVIKENSPALTNVGTIAVKVADGLKDKTVMMKLLNDHGGMFTLKNNVLQVKICRISPSHLLMMASFVSIFLPFANLSVNFFHTDPHSFFYESQF